MLNYELVRAITRDRERDIEGAARRRSLRAAPVAVEPIAQPPVRLRAEEPAGSSSLAASRSR